jgi:GTP:adenosylcobinamide-phosphate guanylyltransferase
MDAMNVLRADAVVLAGGRPDKVAAVHPGAPNKAFVPIAGVPLVARTIAALRAARSIERIIAVAPSSAHGDPTLAGADACRPDGLRITDSLRSGLDGMDADRPVLLVAGDLPVLVPTAIDDFVARALATGAEIAYGCVERSLHEARFPGVPHTWARLREGTFCGAGLTLLYPRILPRLVSVIETAGAARKNPLRLAALFGLDVLVRFAFGRLTIAACEARASAILGVRARAVISPYPEIAVNVDRVSDVALAERLVSADRPAGSATA